MTISSALLSFVPDLSVTCGVKEWLPALVGRGVAASSPDGQDWLPASSGDA